MRPNRRAVLTAALAAPLLGPGRLLAALPPSAAARIAEVETYLRGITTLQARFVQLAANGEASSGTMWLERPSNLRMAYDQPKRMELITRGFDLVFVDYKARQVTYLPVSQTPLAFLLGRGEVTLSGDVTVTDVGERQGELWITMVQTISPEQGQVQVAFGQRPLELRRWVVKDVRGRETVVYLEDVRIGLPLPADVWAFRDPKFFGWDGK
jgi:outer membrane lipoprotein-sorting protein